MKKDFYFASKGGGKLHGCCWSPDCPPKAVVQIVHGIAEHTDRYDDFARFLNSMGILVVAEDHMGHGKSVGSGTIGYFDGGWFSAVADTYQLLQDTRSAWPDLPYVLFGHSMGSFLARSVLAKYPESGISAAVICGTAWQPKPMLMAGKAACSLVCRAKGEKTADKSLEKLVFGSYNSRVEHPKTEFDWLSRDAAVVRKYLEDPMCGFTPTAGLLRDMLTGLSYIETPTALNAMQKSLPVLFIAGGDDPVGNYGKGVRQACDAFRASGMQDVTIRIFPLCRHEILNEINRDEIFSFVGSWMREKLGI